MTDITPPATAEAPSVDPATLFASLPDSWESWCAFRDAVNTNGHVRDVVRQYMLDHLEGQGLAQGLGLYAAGEPARALPHLEAADGKLASLLAARAKADVGQRNAALDDWKGLADDASVGSVARLQRAILLYERRDAEGLDAELAGMSKDAPGDQAFVRGLAADLAGDTEGALTGLQEAIAADADHVEAHFHLARILELHGDDDDAFALLERFRAGELPHHVGALMNLGLLYEDREDHRSAAHCFRMVARADPMNARARRYLADAEASQEQYYDESRERKADKQNAVLRIPVTDFELSVRARNCLQRMNIHTLGDLVCRTETELLSFKNFGETSLQEVKDILSVKGLRLGMMPPDQRGETSGAGLMALAPDGDPTSVKISDLDLSVRSRAALATLGITTVGDLTSTTETTLLSCKNFGQTSLDEIKSKLRGLNLSLNG